MYKIKSAPDDFFVKEILGKELLENGRYRIYELTKRDYSTERAVQWLCRKNNVQRKYIGYCGSKDKHAVTEQHISVHGILIPGDFGDIRIKEVGFLDKPLSLGEHEANHFRIIVRNIDKKPFNIDSFVNYFGEQRFSRNNHLVGKAMIKKDFSEAACMIDHDAVQQYLFEHPDDPITAIKKLPKKIQTLYINAYQSSLWNEAAMRYVKSISDGTFALKEPFGSLVFSGKSLEHLDIPLLSFDTEFRDENIKKIYSRILEQEGLSLRDFIIRSMPYLTPFGGARDLVADVKDLKSGELSDDEINPGKKKIIIEFTLQPGCYATIALRKMFKDR